MSGYNSNTDRVGAPDGAADIKALVELGRGIGNAKDNPRPDGQPYTVIPVGWELKELPTEKLPPRAKAAVKLRDTASFVRYVNDHKTTDSRIYATSTPPRFLAVLDEFPTLQMGVQAVHPPAWREYRAEFTFPLSDEWTVWNRNDKQPKNQTQFAEFIQDNAPDVVDPTSAAMMEMALNFQATEDGSLVSVSRLQNGDTQFAIKSETKLAEGIKMPEFVKLQIPVFENGDVYPLRARMRYRAKDKLVFWYELERPHKVLEAAFKDAWKKIGDGTAVPILLGTPE